MNLYVLFCKDQNPAIIFTRFKNLLRTDMNKNSFPWVKCLAWLTSQVLVLSRFSKTSELKTWYLEIHLQISVRNPDYLHKSSRYPVFHFWNLPGTNNLVQLELILIVETQEHSSVKINVYNIMASAISVTQILSAHNTDSLFQLLFLVI